MAGTPKVWSVELPVEPTAKGAAKVSMRGGFVSKFTPVKTRNAMIEIRALLRSAGAPLFDGPISVSFTFFRKRPKSAKKGAEPITRPDLSNYIKLIEDAANGILWNDDAQIIALSASKEYRESPSVFLKVESI